MNRRSHLTISGAGLAMLLGACSGKPMQPRSSAEVLQKLGKPPEAASQPSSAVTNSPALASSAPAKPVASPEMPPPGPPNPPAPVTTAPPPGPVKNAKFPAQRVTVLPNGLTVIVAENHDLPTADAVLVVPAGSAAEPKDLPGAAEFVARMLKEGTETKSKDEIASAIELVGGDLSTEAGRDTAAIVTHVLSKDLGLALGLMADVAQHPKFDDAAIEKVRQEELSDLADSESNPAYLASRELARVLYGEGPYGHFGATKAALGKIGKADLVAFHGARYVPNAAYLVVVGDVATAGVVKMATQAFGGWKKGPAPRVDLPAPRPLAKQTIYLVDRPGSVQAYFLFGEAALKRASPGWLPLDVMTTVLGGNAAARLFVDLREKQSLTYGAYARLAEARGVGDFRASGQVRNQVVEQAWKAFVEHIRAMTRAAPTPQEMKAAENYLTGTFTISLEQPQTVAQLMVDTRLWGLPQTYWDSYVTRLNAVTGAEAFAAAKRYVHPEREAVVVVGDPAALEPVLGKYADIEVYGTDGDLERKIARVTEGPASQGAQK